VIIEKWMGEEDDLLRIRVRSLAELKQDIPCATREKLAGEKERIETYLKWSQKERADVELRDLRRANRDLQNFNEWLLFKVEGLFFLLFEDHWEARFDGKHVVDSKKPKEGIRAIAHLLDVGNPEGGASEVWTIMQGATTGGLGSQRRVALASDDNLTVNTRALRASIDRDDRDQSITALRKRLSELEKMETEINAEVERRAELLTEEVLDKLQKKAQDIWEQRKQIEAEINKMTNVWGRPRMTNYDARAVGQAIKRALVTICRVHESLGEHLKSSIKGQYGEAIRYEPDDDEGPWKWEVRM
jgi:hypothetical protein